MSELKITQNSLQNSILKDGQFVSGYIQDGSIATIGNGNHAEGCIEGQNTHILAFGNGAHAEGYASAMNVGIDASGNGAHAEGIDTKAVGAGAHAEGCGTQALHSYSHTVGYYTITSAVCQTAIGKYNKDDASALLIVGNGTETDGDVIRKNAFAVVDDSSNSAKANVNGVSDVYLGCPIGSIMMWSGETAPDKWLICDGSVIGITDGNSQNASLYLPNLKTLCETIHYDFYYDHNLRICKLDGQTFQYVISVNDIDSDTPYEWTDDITDALTFNESTQVQDENAVLGKVICVPNLQQRFPLGAKSDSAWMCGDQIYNTNIGENGGEKEHILSWQEMKGHSHRGSTASSGTNFIDITGDGITGTPYGNGGANSEPHNNIPPFIALNFIIKYQ